jgi:predicted dehydrogenase
MEKRIKLFLNILTFNNNAILDELESFADAINENCEVEVSLEDGTEALKVALEIMKLISK